MRETLDILLSEARGMWRFRWVALALAWAIALAGTFYVYSLPDEYRAEARMSVDTESMLQPLLRGLAVRPDVDQQVKMITNTLLSRDNLERIARETDLMLEAETEAEQQALIERLRRQISISGARGDNIYEIDYVEKDPRQAYEVVRSTLDILMEQAVGSTRQDSSQARAFLQQQVEQYEKRLEEAEQKLAEFKRENSGLLPSQEGGYYERLNQAESELRSLREQLSTLQSRRQELQQELRAMRSGSGGTTQVTNPRLREIDQQIQNSERRLNELLLKYTEEHPDVIALEEQIKRLREKREQVASQGATVTANTGDVEGSPVYQQLQIKLNETNAEIAEIMPRIERRQQRIAELKSKVDKITEVEARLKSLTRNYDVTREQYQQLLTRLNSAQLSTDAEQSGRVDFKVIDPPTTPINPVGPDRARFLTVGYAFAMGAAAAAAWLLSKAWPTFLDIQTLTRVTGRPVLGAVSLLQTPGQRRLAVIAMAGYGAALAVFLVAIGSGLMLTGPGSDLVRGLIERGGL